MRIRGRSSRSGGAVDDNDPARARLLYRLPTRQRLNPKSWLLPKTKKQQQQTAAVAAAETTAGRDSRGEDAVGTELVRVVAPVEVVQQRQHPGSGTGVPATSEAERNFSKDDATTATRRLADDGVERREDDSDNGSVAVQRRCGSDESRGREEPEPPSAETTTAKTKTKTIVVDEAIGTDSNGFCSGGNGDKPHNNKIGGTEAVETYSRDVSCAAVEDRIQGAQCEQQLDGTDIDTGATPLNEVLEAGASGVHSGSANDVCDVKEQELDESIDVSIGGADQNSVEVELSAAAPGSRVGILKIHSNLGAAPRDDGEEEASARDDNELEAVETASSSRGYLPSAFDDGIAVTRSKLSQALSELTKSTSGLRSVSSSYFSTTEGDDGALHNFEGDVKARLLEVFENIAGPGKKLEKEETASAAIASIPAGWKPRVPDKTRGAARTSNAGLAKEPTVQVESVGSKESTYAECKNGTGTPAAKTPTKRQLMTPTKFPVVVAFEFIAKMLSDDTKNLLSAIELSPNQKTEGPGSVSEIREATENPAEGDSDGDYKRQIEKIQAELKGITESLSSFLYSVSPNEKSADKNTKTSPHGDQKQNVDPTRDLLVSVSRAIYGKHGVTLPYNKNCQGFSPANGNRMKGSYGLGYLLAHEGFRAWSPLKRINQIPPKLATLPIANGMKCFDRSLANAKRDLAHILTAFVISSTTVDREAMHHGYAKRVSEELLVSSYSVNGKQKSRAISKLIVQSSRRTLRDVKAVLSTPMVESDWVVLEQPKNDFIPKTRFNSEIKRKPTEEITCDRDELSTGELTEEGIGEDTPPNNISSREKGVVVQHQQPIQSLLRMCQCMATRNAFEDALFRDTDDIDSVGSTYDDNSKDEESRVKSVRLADLYSPRYAHVVAEAYADAAEDHHKRQQHGNVERLRADRNGAPAKGSRKRHREKVGAETAEKQWNVLALPSISSLFSCGVPRSRG